MLKIASLLDLLALFEQPIDHWKWSVKVILVHPGYYADYGERVVERLEQDVGEEINGVREDMRVLADEDYLVLQRYQGHDLEEGVE